MGAEAAWDQSPNRVIPRFHPPAWLWTVKYTSHSSLDRTTVGSFTETIWWLESGFGVLTVGC